ncbi:MAG: formylmethanofuran dehydrogenase subunit B [Firmicutes bacterium]|jgi:formylmethanofuran dehydrogenase subunit B|nr:formylmethanofuran dehydrogenase subunit B [Bacillota bacterium]
MRTFENTVCSFCGSLCDDIVLEVEDNVITKARGGCAISRRKFLSAIDSEAPLVDGKEVKFDEAINAAVEILAKARHPLIYGLSSTSSEAQAAAVKLGETLGASVDSTSSVCHGPGTVAKQLVGLPTCTLGEVKNRADVVVFWGCNPVEAHPRHFSRYSVQAKGLLREQGRRDRKVIAVDVRRTATARIADIFLQVAPNEDFQVLTALRAVINGNELREETFGGISPEEIQDVCDVLQSAEYGVFFFGMGLTMTQGTHHNVRQALSLVRDLNRKTAFGVIPMRGHGNVAGTETVLAWQTGYPFGINFSRGYPRYSPGEFTVTDLLSRREVDAALIVASDPAATLPARSANYLGEIPTIVIDPYYSATAKLARVFLPSAPVGVAASGTVYRMDQVPLPLRKVIDSKYPSDHDILLAIDKGVTACSASKEALSMIL